MDTPMLIVTVVCLLYIAAAYEYYKQPDDLLDRLTRKDDEDDKLP